MHESIALAIPHCPWSPERVGTMKRLTEALGLPEAASTTDGVAPGTPCAFYRAIVGPGPQHSSVWSRAAWEWAVGTGASHFLLLQEDALVAPRFWPKYHAMLAALPGEIIAFQANHPVTPHLAQAGCNWYATLDLLVGVAWSCPTETLRSFLDWCRKELKPGAEQRLNEDTLFGLFCATTRRPIWHPIPTLVDHDTSIPSLYGHDDHTHRRPPVTWDAVMDEGQGLAGLEDPRYWVPRNPLADPHASPLAVPYLGRFYNATAGRYARWVRDARPEEADRMARDRVRFSAVPPPSCLRVESLADLPADATGKEFQ